MEPPPTTPQDDEEAIIATLIDARRVRGWPGAPLPVRVDAGDDAAVLADGTALTVDTLVEGVHWNERLSPEDVGFKAVAVSVSDLAATGARPSWALLSLALVHPDPGWVDAFARGLAEACERWDVALIGGDTVRTPGPASVSLTLGGPCVAEPLVRVSARPGDALWVTGTLGLAGAGWRRPAPPPEALAALRRPDPPLSFALALARSGLVSAAMDLSDGLARDLPRLCRASGVGAEVQPERLPGHPCLGEAPLLDQVCGGEDYQLLFTARPDADAALGALARTHGVRLTRVGRITAGHEARLVGQDWPTGGFAHFPREAP